MIRWTRSIRVAHAKYFPQAMPWAKGMAEFLNKKYKIQVSVYMDIFGEIGTIRWYCDYEDLSTFERVGSQIEKDQEYWQRGIQASDFITQTYDTVMRAI
jgi:hypothetical protein